jgi:endonuclease YncB( thermonuclease family)
VISGLSLGVARRLALVQRLSRIGRSLLALVPMLGLVGGLLATTSAPASAASCAVRNVRTSVLKHTLQGAVDTSSTGDTLLVSGTCVGKTSIRNTSLHLKGLATAEQPDPTLDGARLSRVLYVKAAHVTVRNLTVTNGKTQWGGGIKVDRGGRLVLEGTTSVSGNRAQLAGGIYLVYDGSVTMRDHATIAGNLAKYRGAGMWINAYNEGGSLTMRDSSSIVGNHTRIAGGGGIYDEAGAIHMSGTSSVSGNIAGFGAGIAVNDGGSLILDGSASVTGNTAVSEGGGVFIEGVEDKFYVCSAQVAISPNSPDDPPATLPCP